ncbi:hypothetical protein O988_03713 [Pseudogymnoascus sp. VKM F-3808]|nr:hypothetical protein O988_03713 [Pseudogymnoascus sp. VKM F-3808]
MTPSPDNHSETTRASPLQYLSALPVAIGDSHLTTHSVLVKSADHINATHHIPMAFSSHENPSPAPLRRPSQGPPTEQGQDHMMTHTESSFDPHEWYHHFQSCRRYFLDHSQHSPCLQAVAAYVNILLPYQRHPNPISSYSSNPSTTPHPASNTPSTASPRLNESQGESVSLVPYIRRLVVTGFDTQTMLQTFFGDDWVKGIGQIHESERRNYLFASKSGSWLEVKASYEPSPNETIPYMMPIRNPMENEIRAAEEKWSEWLAMQDWMVGPRAPPSEAMRSHLEMDSME